MKNVTPTRHIEVTEDGSQRPTTALERLLNALPAHGFEPCNESMGGIPSRINLSQQRARHLEQTGTAAFTVQTVGPNAKELERRRLFAEGGSRRILPDSRRESRNGARPRTRGAGRPAGRGSSRRSSARSGDSGSEDGPSDEPPSRRRLCTFCGRPLSPERATQARYCSDKHADADRQRRKRTHDRERDVGPRVPTTADEQRMLRFEAGEYERLLRLATCRCNGTHILAGHGDEPSPRCVKSRRQR